MGNKITPEKCVRILKKIPTPNNNLIKEDDFNNAVEYAIDRVEQRDRLLSAIDWFEEVWLLDNKSKNLYIPVEKLQSFIDTLKELS